MSGANPWLQRQRKSDLVELADTVGLKNYESLKKGDLESSLDDYLAEHSAKLSTQPKLAPYYTSRAKVIGSPVKKEAPAAATKEPEPEKSIKVTKRRTKSTEDGDTSTSTAVTRTPAPSRTLSLARRIPLPGTPRDVVNAVDRGTTVVKNRVVSLYKESGITEVKDTARESLSTVTSILFLATAFEIFYLRPALLKNRYAFATPAFKAIGIRSFEMELPDFFLLVTSEFWSAALTWTATSLVVPALFGYFINLSTASHTTGRGRPKLNAIEYTVDPLTFSIVKALLTYVVYAQGATFGGLIDPFSAARINDAVYGGYAGVLVSTAVTALASLYDAVLRK